MFKFISFVIVVVNVWFLQVKGYAKDVSMGKRRYIDVEIDYAGTEVSSSSSDPRSRCIHLQWLLPSEFEANGNTLVNLSGGATRERYRSMCYSVIYWLTLALSVGIHVRKRFYKANIWTRCGNVNRAVYITECLLSVCCAIDCIITSWDNSAYTNFMGGDG